MPLQPPLLVPSGDAENGERIIEAISAHLKRCARPSEAFCKEISAIGGGSGAGAEAAADGTATDLIRNLSHGTHNSYQSRGSHGNNANGINGTGGPAKPIPTPNCCIIPCIDEIILDLERLVTLRDEIVYSFETDIDGRDTESAPDVVTLLREYCALLGALMTVPGLGSLPGDNDNGSDGADGNIQEASSNKDVHVKGLFLTWRKLDEDDGDSASAMDIDADNAQVEEVESHFSVSSLYAERQFSTYLLAVLEYQGALTNLDLSSSPDSAARVLSDMPGARDALKLAQSGFGRAAALFDHLRTVVENDLQEDGAIGASTGTGTRSSGSTTHNMMGSDATRHTFSSGSEIGEFSIPMIPTSPCDLLDPSSLHLFHLASMALGQSCFYYTALVQRKQMHSVLAKLAAGCAEKYEIAATFARQMSEDACGGDGTNGNHVNIRSYMPSKALIRSTFASGEYYYFALAEYHEACVAHAKALFGVEVARFSTTIHIIGKAETELLGSYQNELTMNGSHDGGLSSKERIAAILVATASSSADAKFAVGLKSLLCAKVINLHTEISRLMAKAEEAWADDVPTDIPPTRPQIMMKMATIPPEANFLDPALAVSYLSASPPLQRLLDSTGVEACTDFHRRLVEMFTSAKTSARNATGTAEEELAKLGLPDSISTFKATVEATKSARSDKIRGIPSAMAEQIQSLHSTRGVVLLKQNLYILEEVAALARKTLDETEEMLNDTVRADEEFRRLHPTFSGRDVVSEHEQIAVSSLDGSGVVETNARQICSKIRTWLDQASDGDQKLCQVLEEIETDPKYRLVMLPLDQLEKLVRGGSGRMNQDEIDDEDITSSSSSAGTGAVETLALEKQLEHLNTLIASRERILEMMEKDVLAFNQRERAIQAKANRGNLAVVGAQFYDALTDLSLPLFDHHIEKVNSSIQKQQKVFKVLLQLYSKFQSDRSAYEQEKQTTDEDRMADIGSSPAKAYLQKIASALKTVEWCRPQLVQGRNFYQTILTNIEELKKKVEDVNAVLASERIFFEDNNNSQRDLEQRRRQEEEDERLARELMREAEEAAQNNPQAQLDPRQQEEDERLARELAQQFQEEANISSRNPTDLVDNRDVTMGDANAGNHTIQLEGVVDALGLADGSDRRTGRRNNPLGRERSTSLHRLDENAQHEPPPNVPRRRSSSFADLGDIPSEIFAPRGRSSGSERFSMVSLGGVSSIGSESIVRNFHRQQQLQLQQQQHVGDTAREGQTGEGGDDNNMDDNEDMEENLAGIPVPVRRNQNQADEEMAPAPPSPLGAAARSTLSSGGVSRSGLPGRSSRPGVVNVRNDELPELDVNDEAFAQLVGMDFPPDLVRDALSRYDNVERATEWILQNL